MVKQSPPKPELEIRKIKDARSAAIYLNRHYASQVILEYNSGPDNFKVNLTIQDSRIDQDFKLVEKALTIFGARLNDSYRGGGEVYDTSTFIFYLNRDKVPAFVDKVDFSNRSEYGSTPVSVFGQLLFSTGR